MRPAPVARLVTRAAAAFDADEEAVAAGVIGKVRACPLHSFSFFKIKALSDLALSLFWSPAGVAGLLAHLLVRGRCAPRFPPPAQLPPAALRALLPPAAIPTMPPSPLPLLRRSSSASAKRSGDVARNTLARSSASEEGVDATAVLSGDWDGRSK